ncbi:MAG: hypothetical protein ACRBB3_00690 [Alphaproteobacteria bacterium]
MMKYVLFIFALYFIPSYAYAEQCNKGELAVEFLQMNDLLKEGSYTAKIVGTIDVPTPNYTYSLEFPSPSTGLKEGAMLHGSLRVFKKSYFVMSAQVITPILIEGTVEIPSNSVGIFIDVPKPFSGKPEYFMVRFPDGFDGTKTLCMPPEMYK